MDLIDRKYRILQAIIDDYIMTALPVGSRTISRKYEQKLSSATIRNEMSDLEELGYLDSPHTSAGRIPSYKAYRLYVDRMIHPMPLSEEEAEKQRILAEIMAEDAEENIPEDTDITEEEDPELLTEEMTETDEPEENAVYTKRKPGSALNWDVAGDERYLAENREFKNRSNKFLQFISRPVTIFAAFMVVVVASNLWYNYFGLTVSQKGFHGVMPYKSTIPAYTELMLSTEDKDNKNELLRDEENFLNYMYRLKENDNYSVIISARGDTVGGLNDGARSALKELGLVKLAEAESADRYVAVIEGGKVTREEISDSSDIDTGEFRVLGFKTHVISTQRTSTIQMGKKNFSLNERGMNIVVLDNTTKKIVDKVRFKTYYVMLTATR